MNGHDCNTSKRPERPTEQECPVGTDGTADKQAETQGRRCFCGIEVARASSCREADCPWRR